MKALFRRVRALLVLGRISNLPTVWSNLIVGMFLAGGAFQLRPILPLIVGVSFLYIGGMYLNDFCDAAFDKRYCPERPIPSKAISRTTVGILAAIWLFIGLVGLSRFESTTFGIGLILTAAIVVYNLWHKDNPVAPLLMGFCRFLLYPLSASIAEGGMSWRVFLWASAMGLYVAGISYYARGESRAKKPARWAVVLLAVPILVAIWIGFFYWLPPIFLFTLMPLLWMAWLLVPLWRGTNRSIGRVVSGLLAGIILLDAASISSILLTLPGWGVTYLVLFVLALLLQRIIPAT